MTLFNEWLAVQTKNCPLEITDRADGLIAYLLPPDVTLQDVFRAGMLAAADMVHGIPSLEQQIREAANENN